MKYRKKPVVIEAVQIVKGMDISSPDWLHKAINENKIILHGFGKFNRDMPWVEIKTLEGVMRGNAGDLIIQGVKGELYACKPDIFELTYEAAVLARSCSKSTEGRGTMNMDRELIELAAKAAGIDLHVWGTAGRENYADMSNPSARWNPLTDDGDALRLAVKLRLQITPGTYNALEASVFRAGAAEAHEKATVDYGIQEATRRAIVLAAAEIGRSLAKEPT